MPIRRFVRKYKRRPTFRRTRRVVPIRRPIRRRTRQLYQFKRVCELGHIIVDAGISPTYFHYEFKLSDLPAATEFTSLFDQYRIKGVSFTVYPRSNVSYIGSSSVSSPIGIMYTAIDRDDGVNPASLGELEQYQSIKKQFFNRPHKRYFKPTAVQSGVYSNGGITTGYRTLPSSTWFDCAYPNILYYGIKGAYDASTTSEVIAQSFRVCCTYYIQFRNVR